MYSGTFDLDTREGQRIHVGGAKGGHLAIAELGGAVASEELVVEEDADLWDGELAGQQQRRE